MNVWESKYKKDGFASQRRYPNEALIQFLAANYFSFKDRLKIKILEIGCGSGANLWMVAKEGFSAYGIDISSTGLELCKKMLAHWQVKADISLGDMRKLNFKDNFFDAVFDVVSMQHINLQDHKNAYQEIFRCLKPGGCFFQWHLGAKSTSFIEGGGKKVDKLTIDNIKNKNVPLHDNGLTCFLTSIEAKKMLKSVGFKDINIETISRTYKNITQSIEYLKITVRK